MDRLLFDDDEFVQIDFHAIVQNLLKCCTITEIANQCDLTRANVRTYKTSMHTNVLIDPPFSKALKLVALHSIKCPDKHDHKLDMRYHKKLNQLAMGM